MSLKEYAAVVRAGWRMVAGVLLVCLVVAAGISAWSPRSYQAQAVVFFSVPVGKTPGELSRGLSLARSQVRAYALAATTPFVLDRVRDRLDLSLTTAELADRVRVRTPNGTVIARVSVRWPDPRGAAAVADAVVAELTAAVEELGPSSDDSRAVRVVTVTRAGVPTFAFGLHSRLNLLVGGFVGGSVGVLAAVQHDAWRRRRGQREHGDRQDRRGEQEVAVDEAERHLL